MHDSDSTQVTDLAIEQLQIVQWRGNDIEANTQSTSGSICERACAHAAVQQLAAAGASLPSGAADTLANGGMRLAWHFPQNAQRSSTAPAELD
eukprot:3792019-Amphidinium_carterae.1